MGEIKEMTVTCTVSTQPGANYSFVYKEVRLGPDPQSASHLAREIRFLQVTNQAIRSNLSDSEFYHLGLEIHKWESDP